MPSFLVYHIWHSSYNHFNPINNLNLHLPLRDTQVSPSERQEIIGLDIDKNDIQRIVCLVDHEIKDIGHLKD